MNKHYDVIVIGAGPAGLTAGIYASRAGAKILIIEKGAEGGQSNYAAELENYPGLDGVSGAELSEKMKAQSLKYGAEIVSDEVTSVDIATMKVSTAYNGDVFCKSLILAMGTRNRPLGIDGEDKYIGAGISYCAVCDGGFFRGKTVAVAGGGNTAFKDALYLSKLCKKVYLVHRREGFRADKIYIERAKKAGNIEFVLNCTVTKLAGDNRLAAISVTDKRDGRSTDIEVQGLFVALGTLPESGIVKNQIITDDNGYIPTDENMQTNIKGVFAVGDIRRKPLRQIITAAADGAIAAEAAVE